MEQFDLVAHLTRQMVFSKAAFGPGALTNGVLNHIEKEISEVRACDGCSSKWVDVVILALDGLTRQLWSCSPETPAHEIAATAAAMILGKQSRNETRVWPDWRSAAPGKAVEHDRSVAE